MDEQILEKLNILIKLTAANVIKEDKSQTDSIIRLKSLGIRNKDIAEIVNNSENYIKMVLSRSKKREEKTKSVDIPTSNEEERKDKSYNLTCNASELNKKELINGEEIKSC